MPYTVELPDGTLVSDIPDDMPQDEVRRRILATFPQFAPKQSTFLGELKRGAKQLMSSTQTAAGAITDPEAAARAGVERAQKIGEEAGEGVSFAPVKEAYQREGVLSALGEAASQVPRAVAGMLPAAGAAIAGGKLGAMAGTPIGGPLGAVIGGALGAGAGIYGSIAGANIERQAQEQMERGEQLKIDRPAAYGTAVGQSALEAVGTGAVLGKRLVKGVLGIADDAALATEKARQQLIKEASRSALGATARGAVRGATEIPVEVAQSVLERAQAGLDVLSPEAYAEYGESAYQATIGGAGLGALTGVPERASARAELAKIEVPKERQEAQRRLLAAREGPKGYEGDQALLLPKARKDEFPAVELPTDLAAIEQEFTQLQQAEQTPETQARMAALARQYETVAAKQPEAPISIPPEQLGLGLEQARTYGDMELEKQRLLQEKQTPEVKARVKEITAQQTQMNITDIEQGRKATAQQESEAKRAAESAFAQPEVRETPEGQQLLFSQFEAPQARVEPAPSTELPTREQPPLAPSTLEKYGQRRLGLRPAKEGVTTSIAAPEVPEAPLPPVTEPVPEPKLAPKVPAMFQPVMEKLTTAGVRPETRAWAENAKNRPFLRKLMDMDPEAAPQARKALKLQEGSPKAEVFDALFPQPGVPAFEPAVRADQPSVGVPSKPRVVEAPQPPSAGVTEPVGPGVVPAERAAPAAAKPEGGAKPALKPAEPKPKKTSLKEAEAAWEDNNVEGAGTRMAFKDLSSDRKQIWKDSVEDGTATIDLYEKTAKRQVEENKSEARKAARPDEEALSLRGEERAKQLSDFEQTLRAALNKFGLKDIGLKLINGMTAEGSYAQQLIQIAADSANPIRTLRHEAIHALRELGFFTPQQWQSLSKMAKDKWIDQYLKQRNIDGKPLKAGEESRYDAYMREYAGNMEKITEEAVADAFADFDATKPPAGMVAKVVAKLRNMFQSIKSALTKVESPEKIFGKVEKGELKAGAPAKQGEAKSLRDRATANFLRWFGSSKVVDEKGEPLVVYHGTGADFSVFERSYGGAMGAGMYFTANPKEASVYAEGASGISLTVNENGEFVEGPEGFGNVMPVYLSIKYPYVVRSNKIPRMEDLQAQGYDGVVLAGHWVAFSPNQIKSAIGNNGEYSLTDADIRKSLRAPSPTEGIAETSELMKDQPSELKKNLRDMVRIVSEKDDVSFVTRVRTEVADSLASVVNRVNILFDGAVRDELTGLTNPELKLRQAQATEPLTAAFYATGGLKNDTATGQWVVSDKAGPGGSVKDIFEALKKWGDSKGMSFEQADAEASKMIEARRLKELIQANKDAGETIFPIHKLSNKDSRSPEEQVDVALRGLAANPEVQVIADMMDKQRFYMIDHMLEVGRITKEEAAAYKEAIGYVPFDRIDDFFAKFVPKRNTGKGIAQLGSLPQFVGSTQREVGNVINNHAKLMAWMVKQTIKHDATFTTLNLLADIGQARRLGKNKYAASNAGNVVETFRNGHKEYFEMRSHWDAVAFRDAPEVKMTILKVFGAVSNILRKIVTVMPPFVAKQVTDDIQRAFIYAGVEQPAKLVIPAVTNFLKIAGHELVFGKAHPFTTEFAKKGLVGDIDYNASNPAETILFNMGYSQRGWLSSLHNRLESVTRASDLAIRKAIYERTLAETKSTEMAEGDVGLATMRAREFINFRRRGASKTVGMALATVPFFNAYIQSNDLLLRSMAGRGASGTERAVAKRLFWTQAAKVTAFATIYALASSDDDEYKEQTLDDRFNNWIVGGKTLPVPGDMAALFKVPVEVLMQYMARQGTAEEQQTKEAVKQTLGYAFEQFVGRAFPVPQAIRPVAEALTNYSLVTGRPLVGTYQKGLPSVLQTTTTTSELAKAIANFAYKNIRDPITGTPLELSPIVIDNTVRGYLGGVVPLMNMLVDQLINPNKTDRPLSRYWLLSQYLTPEVPTGPKEEFYDLSNKVMPVKRALDRLMKTDQAAAYAYYQENKDKLKMAELVNIGLQNIKQSREYINFLESADGAKKFPDSADRLKRKQQVEKYENDNLKWVRKAKADIFIHSK